MYKFRKLMKDTENEEVLEYTCEDTENEEVLEYTCEDFENDFLSNLDPEQIEEFWEGIIDK
jgi:hypothetical protein